MDFSVYNYEDYGWIVLLEESDLDGPLDDLCDGGWPFTLPPDYVAGDAAYVIHDELINIMEALQE